METQPDDPDRRGDTDCADPAEPRDERGDLFALVRREARRDACNAQGTRAKFFVCDVGEIRAVNAAGECDERRTHLAKERAQRYFFCRGFVRRFGEFPDLFFNRQTARRQSISLPSSVGDSAQSSVAC